MRTVVSFDMAKVQGLLLIDIRTMHVHNARTSLSHLITILIQGR